jgi:hypothetical protein
MKPFTSPSSGVQPSATATFAGFVLTSLVAAIVVQALRAADGNLNE